MRDAAADRHNRAFWDADAADYQVAHGAALADAPMAWGVWRIPEADLRVLGEVAGLDVLELGCGAAQWARALRAVGAHAVGLDLSRRQLQHAAGSGMPLVQASGTDTPFRAGSFDVVFADHGAFSFCPPEETVAESARLLRSGGLLAFCASTPLLYLTEDGSEGRHGRRLRRPYFGMRQFAYEDGTHDFVIPTGAWIRLFRAHGLVVEDLVELRAPRRAETTYGDFVDAGWARQWPAEQIWKARRS